MRKNLSKGPIVFLCLLLASGFAATCGDDESSVSTLDQCLKVCQKTFGTCADEVIEGSQGSIDSDGEVCFNFEEEEGAEACYDSFEQEELDAVLGLCQQSCGEDDAESEIWADYQACVQSKTSESCQDLAAKGKKAWEKAKACIYDCALDLDCHDIMDGGECNDKCGDLVVDAAHLDDDFFNKCGKTLVEARKECEAQAPETDECALGCHMDWVDDGFCDSACNVEECDYDGSDCEDDML